MPKKQPAVDLLDELVSSDKTLSMALMLWKNRRVEPDMYVKIEEKDIRAFNDCCDFLKVKPTVKLYRPEGMPAQDAISASGGRRAVPAREAIPAKPYVIIALVDKQNGHAIKAVENNEEDYDISQASGEIRKARDQAPMLANRLLDQARTGEFSLSDMQDACDALLILARSV